MATTKPITFAAGGDTFTLHMGFNAMCQVEEDLDKAFMRVVSDMQGGLVRLSEITAIFRASLLRDRPEITSAEAASLIEEIGLDRATELVASALEASPIFKAKPKAKKAA